MSSEFFRTIDSDSLDAIIHCVGDAFCVIDSEMRFVAANHHFALFYGKDSANDLIGFLSSEVAPKNSQTIFSEVVAKTCRTGEPTTRYGFSSNLKKWVVIRCLKLKENRFVIIVHQMSDVTMKAGYIPQYDNLTSLPNRWAFEKDLEQGNDSLSPVRWLMLIDIGQFRRINETLGFQIGDMCLLEVAGRIRQSSLKGERVYRIGNDQFLLMGNTDVSEIKSRQGLILDDLTQPIILNQKEYVLSYNMGVFIPDQVLTGSQLLANVELALNEAKLNKSGYAEYCTKMSDSESYDLSLNKSLREAIKNNEMEVFYQPQLDMKVGEIVSAEALVRWRHPVNGIVPPVVFLPFAEDTGLIGELDRIVIEKTMMESFKLEQMGIEMELSFNLSAQSICDVSIVTFIEEMIKKTGANPELLGVEITETSLMRDVEVSKRVIIELREMGFNLSIDDFGSGYSSMAYLLRYPSHFLKIDKTFVIGMEDDVSSQSMVKNLIGLAHGMGIKVVAEGIENQNVQDMLRKFGCDIGQGYHIAKPMSVDDFENWIFEQMCL